MRILPLLIICLASQCTWADNYPAVSKAEDYIDGKKELLSLGSMDGSWVGNMVPAVDRAGANRQYPEGYLVQVTIDGEKAQLAFVEEDNKIVPFENEALLLFAEDGSALINYVAGSAIFTETWTVSLAHIAPNTMKAIVTRTVHNFSVRRDSPWRVFSVYADMELNRNE